MNLLRVEHLAKSFGGVHAVRDVSFELPRGQLLALIGPNGAGKSTCFNVINGQLRADRGRVLLEGRDIVGLRPREIWRCGVGRTFQVASTYGSMTALENVQMGLISRDRRLFRMWRPAARHRRDEAMSLLEQVGLADRAGRAAAVLAYGDVKRLELAMALTNDPKLLLMDEPTAGMAARERHELMALTRRLVTERQASVLFTEHSMDVVFACADHTIVLAGGEVIASGSPAEIGRNPLVREVYFGRGLISRPNEASS